MTEVLFTLTVIFAAYIAYVIVNEKKVADKFPESEPLAKAVVAVEATQPEPAIKENVAKNKPSVIVKKPVIASTSPSGKGSIRNPKTGEIAVVTSNYRFTKRWIKEALVTEGLLSKIYKNNELDAETDILIKSALLKLEAIDKYRIILNS